MHIDYSSDRIPVTPLGVVIGDQIHAVHIVEGSVEQEIDVTVTSVYAELQATGHYLVTVGHDGVIDDLADDGDPLDPARPLRLDDPGMWVSVTFPRPGHVPARDVFEVAA